MTHNKMGYRHDPEQAARDRAYAEGKAAGIKLMADVGRRERIATAALTGMIQWADAYQSPDIAVLRALRHADALIAALDAKPEQENKDGR